MLKTLFSLEWMTIVSVVFDDGVCSSLNRRERERENITSRHWTDNQTIMNRIVQRCDVLVLLFINKCKIKRKEEKVMTEFTRFIAVHLLWSRCFVFFFFREFLHSFFFVLFCFVCVLIGRRHASIHSCVPCLLQNATLP